jgi:hypothetical protein
MVPSPHPSACYALAAADRRKDAQVNQFHDHGRVRQHAAMTGSRRQAAAAVAPARWRPSGWAGYAAAGWALSSRCGVSIGHLGERWGWGPFRQASNRQPEPVIGRCWRPATSPSFKAVGMSPRQLLAMVMTASAVLGVIG